MNALKVYSIWEGMRISMKNVTARLTRTRCFVLGDMIEGTHKRVLHDRGTGAGDSL